MANTLYPKFKEGLLKGQFNLLTATVKAMLIKSGYVYSDTHQYVSDILDYDNGRSSELINKSVTNGVFNANPVTLNAIGAYQVIAVVLYIDTGSDSTSPLVAYIDTAAGLPFTPPAGGEVTIAWDTGTYKIFSL